MISQLNRNLWWLRHQDNPVLPPIEDSEFECSCCMNPYVLRIDDDYHLYYAGGDADGHKRICLATAPVNDVTEWTRHGPLFDLGEPESFDASWCVLPHVIEFEPERWHLYYTGNCGQGEGLSSFPGIGLAVSEDGKTWQKYEGSPVLSVSKVNGDPDSQGMAGGSVIQVKLPDGSSELRFYYTGCPSLGNDLFLNQQKTVCYATSSDGIEWEKRGAVMLRDPDRDYENVAVAGPVVHQNEDGSFRMWYSAIGTRWGYYSIGYAESDDGIEWQRGERHGENLQLTPAGDGWERQMVEYPSVIQEGWRLRLFYCGNGYGSTGIGTAVSSPLRAIATKGPCLARIVSECANASWHYRVPEGLSCDEGTFKSHAHPIVEWHGPDANGAIWHEWQTNDKDFEIISGNTQLAGFGLEYIQGIHYRIIITPTDEGLSLKFTATNLSEQTFHRIDNFPCLGQPSPHFQDEKLERTFIITDQGITPLKDTDRGTGDPCRTHFHIEDKPGRKYYGPPFWGEASRTRATSGAIMRTSADGRFTIGTTWENVCEVFHNEDSHHCIHSLGCIDELKPGETKSLAGKIVLVEGGPEDALERLTSNT
jgi:predicted GH43/DUF377 family glycosyl hydrolase